MTNKRIPGKVDDELDFIHNRLVQVNALLGSCYGVGKEWLTEIGEERRDAVLWLVSDLVEELQESFDGVHPKLLRRGGPV